MLQLLKTSDGSHTIRHLELNETYHSIHGAVQESKHVFIQNGLHFYIEKHKPSCLKILEVGFGTGLNAFLTMIDEKSHGISIMYDAVEAFPLPGEMAIELNYPDFVETSNAASIFSALHKAAWNETSSMSTDFTLRKMHNSVQATMLEKSTYDIVYFDAFAPKTQPDMWSASVLSNVIWAIKTGGVLVTYCASGQFKRDLKSLQVEIEVLPGPPGKKEMVRASRIPK